MADPGPWQCLAGLQYSCSVHRSLCKGLLTPSCAHLQHPCKLHRIIASLVPCEGMVKRSLRSVTVSSDESGLCYIVVAHPAAAGMSCMCCWWSMARCAHTASRRAAKQAAKGRARGAQQPLLPVPWSPSNSVAWLAAAGSSCLPRPAAVAALQRLHQHRPAVRLQLQLWSSLRMMMGQRLQQSLSSVKHCSSLPVVLLRWSRRGRECQLLVSTTTVYSTIILQNAEGVSS